MYRSQLAQRHIELVNFPISLTGQFCRINPNGYTSYKGGCQNPGVDFDLKVTITSQTKDKFQALVVFLVSIMQSILLIA